MYITGKICGSIHNFCNGKLRENCSGKGSIIAYEKIIKMNSLNLEPEYIYIFFWSERILQWIKTKISFYWRLQEFRVSILNFENEKFKLYERSIQCTRCYFAM